MTSSLMGSCGLVLAAAITTVAPRAFSADSLSSRAPMSAARAAHTASVLPDGRVLIVGGMGADDSRVVAELYDPTRDRYEPVAPLESLRHSHTATRLPDGRVLIVGGYEAPNTPSAQARMFDPATNRFVPTGAMRQARAGHVAVLLMDGSVLVAGGVGPNWSYLASAERYDPATGQFTPAGAMTTARESHVAVRLNNGRVLVVGGHQGRRAEMRLFASAEEFDPATGRFGAVGSMQQRRHKHDAVLMADGQVLVTGGSNERDEAAMYDSAERYDPATRRFTPVAARMRYPRYKHAGSSVLLRDGRVLVAGGAGTAELFDPALGRFEPVASSTPLAGNFPATALLPDGRVLITGGYGSNIRPQSGTWIFTPRKSGPHN